MFTNLGVLQQSVPGRGSHCGVLQAQEGNVELAMRCGQQPLRQLAPGGRITFSMAHISKTGQLSCSLRTVKPTPAFRP